MKVPYMTPEHGHKRRRLSSGSTAHSRTVTVSHTDSLPGGVTRSIVRVKPSKPVPKGFIKHGPLTVNDVWNEKYTGTGGIQNVTVLAQIDTMTQALTGGSKTAPYRNVTSIRGFDLLPDATTTNTTVLPSLLEGSNEKYYIKRVDLCCDMANFSNAPCKVQVVLLKAKKHITRPQTDTSGVDSPNFNTNYDAGDVWNGALGLQSIGIAREVQGAGRAWGSNLETHPGTTFGDSPEFFNFYKVVNSQTIQLAAGAQHCFQFNIGLNNVRSASSLQMANSGYRGVADDAPGDGEGGIGQNPPIADNRCRIATLAGGYEVMMIFTGCVGYDTVNSVVTYAPPELGGVFQRKFHYGLVKAKNTSMRTSLGVNLNTVQTAGNINLPLANVTKQVVVIE